MNVYSGKDIRNVALLGHSSSGKTTLTESALFTTGAITRQGKIDDGNTVSDFGREEIERGVSIGTTSIPVEFKEIKINFLDTPGYFDFIGEMYGAKRASEGTVLVVDASSGIQVGTEKSWNNLEKYNTPRVVFLNKMDRDGINYEELIEELQITFDKKIIPFTLPVYEDGKFVGVIDIIDEMRYTYENGPIGERHELNGDYQDLIEKFKFELSEKIAETSEELLEKYFAGEKFTHEEMIVGIKNSIMNGDLTPILVGSAEKSIGIDFLLDTIIHCIPKPDDMESPIGLRDGEEITFGKEETEPFSAVVFKTIVDPYLGKLTLFRVMSGKLTENMHIYNSTKEEEERLGGLFLLRGKTQIKVPELKSGDIGATSRLDYTETGDTLCTKDDIIVYETIEYPQPTLFAAVEAKDRSDEDKVIPSLRRLREEDPTFTIDRNAETKQFLLGGQGNMQIRAIVDKLKNAFDVEVDLKDPKVAYRETIRSKSDVQGRHRRQSGGAGQYGDVHIKFEPCDEDFIFEEEVFGGAVPRNYYPAVEKGIEEAMREGVLAGYPVTNIKAILYDGSYHPVDSNEMAFKIAASMAFKKGIKEAKPILLEPIMSLEIEIPEEYLGDIMGDMNKRRGRILGMKQDEEGNQIVDAEAPQAELFNYAIDLRAMTQSRGKFTMDFIKYEEVPGEIAENIIKNK